jgi:hypothetical protein
MNAKGQARRSNRRTLTAGRFCALTCLVTLLGAGCAGTVKQAAKDAAPAALEGAVDEAQDPETRNNIAQILADPQIRAATADMAEAVIDGALRGVTDQEQSARLERVTNLFVTQVGSALATSLQRDIGPALASTFANAVEGSLAGALDGDTEERLQALAVAVSRGTLHGVGESMLDMNGQPSPALSYVMGQFARDITREAAFGFQDAVTLSVQRDADGHTRGDVLATVGRLSDLLRLGPILLVGGLLLLLALGAAGLLWALLSLRRQRRLSRAHEDAALALARAIKATENAAWSDELRAHLARATDDDAGGEQLRRLLRDHAELKLSPRPRAPRSDGNTYMG